MDNRYYNYNCPPLMNDGRFLTSYVRSKVFDQYIRNVNNIDSSHQYKLFLQNNGDQILNNLKSYLRENNTCKIEGKCLPKSIPKTFDYNFLNENFNKNPDWFNQITNLNDNKIPTEINNVLANQLANDIFNKKVASQNNSSADCNTCYNCNSCTK